MSKGVSIVCPTYNEVAYSVSRIKAIYNIAKKHFQTFEIVIIDDGSTDGNYQQLITFAKNKPWLRIIRHGTNRGIAHSVRDAYANARFDWIVWFSLGEEWNTADIPRLASGLANADIVVGYRPEKSYHWSRNFASSMYRLLTRLLFGVEVFDAGSIKAVKRQVIEEIPIIAYDVFDEAERIIRASRAGFRITAIAISHLPTEKLNRSRPKLRQSILAIIDAIRLRIHFWLATEKT